MATGTSGSSETPEKEIMDNPRQENQIDHRSERKTLLAHHNLVQTQPMARRHGIISLLPAEQLLRQLLLDYRDNMPSDLASSKLEIWLTGGWVRDRLLGIQSSDIDVALSTKTGIQFGRALEKFFHRNEARYRQKAQGLGVPLEFNGLHRTRRNPAKSKHLETCVASIFGFEVDLVNLRKETYSQDSRIPEIEFGTAEEDALRRDATINALFYNLDKQQVEDFTGRGLQDMAAGILRTPLDPYLTFADDPLRVLRVIRIASKLGFTIDDETKQSMKDERIHAALDAKISRERVGLELGKMMNGPNPLTAFQLIYEMRLYSTVFLPPTGQLRQALTNLLPQQKPDRPWPSTWPRACRILAALLEDTTSLGKELAQSDEKGVNCWMMAAYAPIAGLRRIEPKVAVKDVTKAVKAVNKTSKLLDDALEHMEDIQLTVNLVAEHDPSTGNLPRSTVGMAIRSWGDTWRLQVLYSLLAEVAYEASDDGFFAAQLGRYSKFVEFVCQQKLQDAPFITPILNGDDINRLFKLEKRGPFMKLALDGIVRWQFDNKDGSRDEAIEWLLTQKEILGIP